MIILTHRDVKEKSKKYKATCKCGCSFIFNEHEMIANRDIKNPNYHINCPECGHEFYLFDLGKGLEEIEE